MLLEVIADLVEDVDEEGADFLFIIGVDQGKCVLVQGVEQELLAADVLAEGLVVVQMVVGDVGEYRAPEVQTPYAALVQGV